MKQYTRRRVLKLAGVVALTGVAGQILPLPKLNAAMPTRHTQGLADLLQISRQLTMQTSLNEAVGLALFNALQLIQPNISQELGQLKQLLAQQPELLEQPLLSFPESNTSEEKLAKTILAGWYSGVVGKGKQAIYITYVNTLANQLVADKLVPPSFSYGPCGSWQKKP